MSIGLIRFDAAATLYSWIAGSALDAAFLSSVLGAAVRPTGVVSPTPVDQTDGLSTRTAGRGAAIANHS
jgi:hypothetical protein